MEQNIHWTSLYLPSNARCISEFELLNEKLQVQLKADLKRDIYTQNKIKEKEISVVEYLARFRPVKEDVLTPESDVYVTPESSPTDAHYSFGPARCASDSSLVKASPSDNKYLHTTNPLYYSLVTVDEVYPCESADILEKELAEQDQLFKSFKSIISRDSKVSKIENKSGLKISQSQNTLRSSSPKQRSVNKSLELKLLAKLSKKDNYSFKNSNSTIKNQWLKNVVSTNLPISSANSPTHSKDNGDVCNCRRIKGFCDGSKPCEITIMSKPKLDIDEVLDAESNGGPDSCLEAGSSGYLTGSSPRDHTVSEPYGGDLTEVATSDDIPHDNDQSARSSSMSSDAGTWDSTFPAVSEGTVKEQITGEKTKRPVELGDHDCNLTISNEPKTTGEAITVCYSTCPIQSISVVNIINKSYVPSADNPLIFNDGGSRKHCELNSSTFESYKPEKAASNSAISDREMAFKNKEDKLCSSKNNFFIDAASLLDENEMSSIPPNSLSCNGYESQDGSSWSGSDVGNCVPRASDQSRLLTDIKTNDMQSPEQNNIELRRGSLIRRNTFELELDDERLEKLRVKCEKHKEKSPHYLSNSFSANNGGSKEFSLADNCRQKPNTLPGQLDPFTQTQKADDEVHSPDSLNNDGPLYEPLEKHHKTENCYPLPFEMNSYASLKDYNDPKMNAYSSEEQSLTNYLGGDSTILSDIGSNNASGHFNSFNREILNNIESTPILSGGICSQDVPPEKVFSSPLMNRRKTEFAPIISGGAVVEPEPEPLPKPRSNSSFSASWVVDMSEQSKNSEIESVSMKETSMDSNVSDDIQRPSKSNNSSLGYFISLDSPTDDKVDTQRRKSGPQTNNKDIDSIKTVESNKIEALTSNANQSSCSSSSCGFYVDLKDNPVSTETSKEKESAPDKKLFSMFIDIGDSKTIDGSKSNTCSPHVFKKRNHTRTFSGVFPKTSSRLNESQKSSQSSLDTTESSENLREAPKGRESTPIPEINAFANTPNSSTKVEEKPPKQGFFMFIENDNSPVPQRRTLPSGQLPSSQRHSWNSDSHNFNLPIIVNNGNSGNIAVKNNHRRSHSVSVNKSLEVMFNVEQNENKSSSASPLVKGSTSNSIGYESGPSSIDESGSASKSCNKRMMASWHGSIKPSAELQKVIAKGDLKERESRTIYKKHSLDATSEIADEICDSIDKSDEICQSQTESKGDDTFDISNTSNESSNIHNSTFIISDISNVANATSNDLELTTPTCDIVSQLSKDDSDKTETDFDDGRDKKSGEIPRTPDHSMSHVEIPPLEPKFSFVKLSDMDKEPKKLVVEEKNVPNRMSRSIPEASWIETKMMTRSATSRSLSRLFPHLNTSNRNPTPDSGERESDYSELSSMQSSMDPSALEGSTEDTDASAGAGGPVSRLGEDLLRMFLDEISPDVTVEVGGRRIKAHKCILSSRCQYFAAILSGGWVESAGNVISLQGFSYSAVHFALCHIYSGVSNIPDSINIVELATLADMLCLEGLKEVIMYTLKVKYCHFFHKPCPMCTVGVLECLPLAAAYGLDEIYRKSLRWINKHFVRVWPTKGFATLPKELLDKCYKQHVVHMTVDNVLETVLCCHKLQGLIPNVRWAEPVFTLATKLYEATVKFIAQHYCEILSCDTFMSLGRDQAWSASQLEETLVSAAERLPPDQACRSHSHLHKLSQAMLAPESPLKPSDGFCEFVRLLSTSVEGCLLRQAARASRTPAWALMEPQLRHRIQDSACLVIVPGDDRRRARHLAKKAEALGTGKRPVELLPAKNTVSDVLAHKRHNSAVRTSVPPAVKPKTPQPVNKAENTGSRPKTWPYKIIEVKSRYLEPKATPKPSPAPAKPERTTQARRATSKSIISSSDSSRTSSPAMRRAGAPRVSRSLPCKRDDTLTMSTDSLTDPASSSQKKRADTITKSQSTASRIDFVERNIKSLSLKSVRASSGEKAKPKAEEKPKFSPVAISKKTSTQSSPHVRDSPSAVKSTVNSTPSPLLRRNTLSPKEKYQLAETKSAPLKRTSTYRVAPKAARPRETGDASPNNKGNINKIQKVTASKKSVANNNFISDNRKTDKPQPMVGSRSGTFLKDEPTVLKKPQVVDVSE